MSKLRHREVKKVAQGQAEFGPGLIFSAVEDTPEASAALHPGRVATLLSLFHLWPASPLVPILMSLTAQLAQCWAAGWIGNWSQETWFWSPLCPFLALEPWGGLPAEPEFPHRGVVSIDRGAGPSLHLCGLSESTQCPEHPVYRPLPWGCGRGGTWRA